MNVKQSLKMAAITSITTLMIGVIPSAAETLPALTLVRYAFYGDLADFEIPSGIYLCNRSRTYGQRQVMAQKILSAGIASGVLTEAEISDGYRYAVEDELKDGVCNFGNDSIFKP